MSHSRRTFLKTSAALAAVSVAGGGRARALASHEPDITPRLKQFGYADVTLLEGPLKEQFDRNHAFYQSLNEDSLLKPFRQKAGLPAPGEDMGGWYSWATDSQFHKEFEGFIPGHSFGQYVSGLSRDYAATGEKATQAKVHRLVKGFAPAITPDFWKDYRLPAYTYDKMAIGMIDAHQFAADPLAMKALDKALDSVLPHLPPGPLSRDAQEARVIPDVSYGWDEPYTLPENFFLAWQRGAGSRYRELGIHYLADSWYWDPLAEGQNVLPGKHAYSHVNAMSSAMQAYFVLGSQKHLHAAKNGFEFLTLTQSYSTGGWGPDERFRLPGDGEMGESLTDTHSSFETPCGSYAHFKLTRYLIGVTRESRYGDSMERVMYNTILGALPIQEDGHGFYYSDYNEHGSKFYHPNKWTCCSGTFSEITADYGISSYFHDDQGIYVNLFVPSKVRWMRGGNHVVLTQKTEYPYRPMTTIEVSAEKAERFPVYLRVPAWAGAGTRIAVNGKTVAAGPEPGRFAKIEREWKSGDRIEMEFAMSYGLEAIDGLHKNMVALTYGPLTLFAVDPEPAGLSRADLLGAAQTAAGSTEWQVKTATGTMRLRSFPELTKGEPYRLYQKV